MMQLRERGAVHEQMHAEGGAHASERTSQVAQPGCEPRGSDELHRTVARVDDDDAREVPAARPTPNAAPAHNLEFFWPCGRRSWRHLILEYTHMLLSALLHVVTPGISSLCDELPRSPSKAGCRLNLSHIVSNELSSLELQDAMQMPAAIPQTAAMYQALRNMHGCVPRQLGMVCVRQNYIVKWVSRRPS
jgi:hypothetical protein